MIKEENETLKKIYAEGHWRNSRHEWCNFESWINHHLRLKSLFKSQFSEAEFYPISDNDR